MLLVEHLSSKGLVYLNGRGWMGGGSGSIKVRTIDIHILLHPFGIGSISVVKVFTHNFLG